MALTSTTVWEIQSGGSDTANGCNFDPSNGNFSTNLAATVATSGSPVVTSASYNFVAGDVGNWVFIAGGTNWLKGWYKIASVASNAATLTASIATGVTLGYTATTVIGCASTASPTGGTWSIDYSQTTSPTTANTLTGLTSAGAGLVVLCSTSTVAMIGNGIQITGGTNFNVGVYNVSNVSIGVNMTLVGPTSADSGVGASGTANVGGCAASPGFVAGILVGNSQTVFVKSATYIISNTANVSGGLVNYSSASRWIGYVSMRGDAAVWGTMPSFQAAHASMTVFTIGNNGYVANIQIDGNVVTYASVVGMGVANGSVACRNVRIKNCGSNSFIGQYFLTYCEASGNTGAAASIFLNQGSSISYSISWGNAGSGIRINGQANVSFNASSGNVTGFEYSAATYSQGNVAYGNSSTGFFLGSSAIWSSLTNDMAYGTTGGYGFDGSVFIPITMQTCVGGNNSLGNVNPAFCVTPSSFIPLTTNPFVSASTRNFALNNTAGGGAALRQAGYGVGPGSASIGYPDIGAIQNIALQITTF